MTFEFVIGGFAYLSPLLFLFGVILIILQIPVRLLERVDRISGTTTVVGLAQIGGAAFGCFIVYKNSGSPVYGIMGDLFMWILLIGIALYTIGVLFDRYKTAVANEPGTRPRAPMQPPPPVSSPPPEDAGDETTAS